MEPQETSNRLVDQCLSTCVFHGGAALFLRRDDLCRLGFIGAVISLRFSIVLASAESEILGYVIFNLRAGLVLVSIVYLTVFEELALD